MRRGSVLLLVSAIALAACSGGDDERSGETPPVTRDLFADAPVDTPPPAGTEAPATTESPDEAENPLDYSISWEQVGSRTEGGWLTVPNDYSDPSAGTIDLFVVRHLADEDQRIGSLLTNNGGPGVGASTVARNATSWFPSEITDRFDIVSWDPRGTGASDGAVDCIDDDQYDEFFGAADVTPEDDAERQILVDLAQRYAEQCVSRTGDALPRVGTNNSARDMDAIRQALGEDQVSYFGFSYGSELGGVWATMYPGTVRAAVFDGAADPNADPLESQRQQRIGFEAALDTFLAQCSADEDCVFHNDGNAEGAYDLLLAAVDENPVPTRSDRIPVNQQVMLTGVTQAMYSDAYWPALERSLQDALDGDGLGLLALHDAYYRRGDGGEYSNLIEAFQGISCADVAERKTVEESDADAQELLDVAPRLFPYTTGSYFCTSFPDTAEERGEITGVGAGPIVVIGTTGDPSTPLDSSTAMAATLDKGRLIIVEADRHTGYSASACAQELVEDYLVWLEPPKNNTVCSD